MGAIPLSDSRFSLHHVGKDHTQNGDVVEEVEGLIRLYKDGHVERFQIVPHVTCTFAPEADMASRDVTIDGLTGTWMRLYLPKRQAKLLPLVIYFHGGGFCVGSVAWKCYHEFLSTLASRADCMIMSVNYRLAPEDRLPAAYEDGFNAVKWVRQQALSGSNEHSWWRNQCDFSRVFLAGDSAGACLAHNVAVRLGSPGVSESTILKPLCLKGVILIQPFFGGETRTSSEKNAVQPPYSALSLTASDAYWRLALPFGATRDHLWCNPLAKGAPKLEDLRLPPALVCISELDIMKDRNLVFCNAMKKAGKSVQYVVYVGVGHAFQILHNYPQSQLRTHELVSHVKAFINH